MIIYLLEELIDKCQLNSPNPLKVDFFENIAIARRNGNHFLIGDKIVFELLRNLTGLSELAKSIFNRIFVRYSTEYTILTDSSFIVKIGIQNNNLNGVLTFNIDDLNSDSFCNDNNLLLENTVDTFIYEKSIDLYRTKNLLTQVDYKWDLRNGGGTTSYAEYTRLNNLKNVYTFAILDSDKICPNSPIGGTALQFINNNITYFGDYEILDAHELENLVPGQIYSQYIESKFDTSLNMNLGLIALNSEIFKYIDIKKGIKKYTILNSPQHTKNYYCQNLGIAESSLNCGCTSKNSCNCFIFYPMSRNIIAQIKEFIDQQNINLLSYVGDFLEVLYLELGKKLFWIFCKSSRINA